NTGGGTNDRLRLSPPTRKSDLARSQGPTLDGPGRIGELQSHPSQSERRRRSDRRRSSAGNRQAHAADESAARPPWATSAVVRASPRLPFHRQRLLGALADQPPLELGEGGEHVRHRLARSLLTSPLSGPRFPSGADAPSDSPRSHVIRQLAGSSASRAS